MAAGGRKREELLARLGTLEAKEAALRGALAGAAEAGAGGGPGDVDLLVAGGGLAGALAAATFAKAGLRVQMREKRPDPRAAAAGKARAPRRSINLALSERGFRALRAVGLEESVKALGVPMTERAIHKNGAVTLQPYGGEGQALYSVSREALGKLLLDAAEAAGAEVVFESALTDAGETGLAGAAVKERARCVFTRPDGGREAVRADLLLGCDGVNSRVREILRERGGGGFDFTVDFIAHGYKELTIPALKGGVPALRPANALHIWPRKSFMLIALPNPDGSFVATLFMKAKTPGEEVCLYDLDRVPVAAHLFFKMYFPDAFRAMPDLVEEFKAHPSAPLQAVTCTGFHRGASAVLLGDAAHAVTPFLGQGCNAAFEDVRYLREYWTACDRDWRRALPRFTASRKPDADALREMAEANYREMAASTLSVAFRLEARTLRALERATAALRLPAALRVKDLHSLVSFTNVPYAECRARARRADAALLLTAVIALAAYLALIGWCARAVAADPPAGLERLERWWAGGAAGGGQRSGEL